MQLKNTKSVDMARFLMMLDEIHAMQEQDVVFQTQWPVLYYTIRTHENSEKIRKINRLQSNKHKLANKIIETQKSDDANKSHKIRLLQSYIRNIDSTLRQISR